MMPRPATPVQGSSPALGHCRGIALALAAVATGVLLLAPSALGANKYVSVGQFPPPFPDNQSWVPQSIEGVRAQGIAVSNKNGHVYVADSGRGAIFDYESTADSTATLWDGETTPAGSFGGGHVSVAVDNTSGDVYVADTAHSVIVKFDEAGTLIASFGDTTPAPDGQLSGAATPAGSFVPPTNYYSSFGIAVNQATHELYVLDAGHEVIDVFDENGIYLRQITDKPEGLYSEGGEKASAIAVSSGTGNVYVSDWGSGQVFKFDPIGDYSSTWNGGDVPNGSGSAIPQGRFAESPILLAVEDATQRVLVGDTRFLGSINVFDEAGNFIPPQLNTEGGASLYNFGGFGLDQATGYLYTAALYSGPISIFKPLIVPDVEIHSAAGVTRDSTSLTGHVDTGGGGDITACRFEYIAEGEYLKKGTTGDPWRTASQAPCQTNPPSSPPFSGPTDVSADISGLEPGHTYHLRLVATSAVGTNVDLAQDIVTEGEYHFASAFGAAGGGDGQLSEPRDVAVDNATGDVYVADTGNHRIVKFDASGNFVAAWGWGVDDGGSFGQVCTAGCQVGISGSGPGQFQSPRYVEVDNSAGASAHAVYVADTADGTVQKFTPSGILITDWGEGGSMDLSHNGPIYGMTVDTIGDLFVVTYLYVFPTPYFFWTQISQDGSSRVQINASGFEFATPGDGGIEVSANGGFYETLPQGNAGVMYKHPNGRQGEFLYLYHLSYSGSLINSGIALDRLRNDAYVAQGTYIDQIKPHQGCYLAPTPNLSVDNLCEPDDTFGHGELTEASGLAFSPSSRTLYAADAAQDRIAVFEPLPMPVVTTGAADLESATVRLSGQVDPATAGTATGCRFEYGTDLAYADGSAPCSPGGSFSVNTDVSADLSGLGAGITYHYRLVAEGSNAWPSYGMDKAFTVPALPPTVDGGMATNVGPTGATLSAQVNPKMSSTIFRFEYGTTTDYGSATPISAPIGADDTTHAVSTTIAGLEPGATYHFRVVAINFSGRTVGADGTFNTPGASSVVSNPTLNTTTTAADAKGASGRKPHCRRGFVRRHGKCRKRRKARGNHRRGGRGTERSHGHE